MTYTPMFIIYAILFAFSFVMTARAILLRKWDGINVFVILASYALLSVFMQLGWCDIGNRFGTE